jgi:hypothetical protein
MATKGIKARRRAASDGFLTGTGSLSIAFGLPKTWIEGVE